MVRLRVICFGYTNEEAITRMASARALEHDIRFMSSLLKAYKTSRDEARKFFYQEKFGIVIDVDLNSTKNNTELTKLLTLYCQGLQYYNKLLLFWLSIMELVLSISLFTTTI